MVEIRVFVVSLILLLLFGIVTLKLPALAAARPLVLDDVKRETPGQVIDQGQSVHIDVLALVNVTVTDPYNRLVTGLDRASASLLYTDCDVWLGLSAGAGTPFMPPLTIVIPWP